MNINEFVKADYVIHKPTGVIYKLMTTRVNEDISSVSYDREINMIDISKLQSILHESTKGFMHKSELDKLGTKFIINNNTSESDLAPYEICTDEILPFKVDFTYDYIKGHIFRRKEETITRYYFEGDDMYEK